MKKNKLPEYEQLRLKAIERHELAMTIMSPPGGQEPSYDLMMENCHYSVELIMKALINKETSSHPQTHNLIDLSNHKVRNVKFLHSLINKDRNIKILWLKICSMWDTSDRYAFMELDPLDFDEFFDAYTRVYKWMLIRC